jgi:hypothetical protein
MSDLFSKVLSGGVSAAIFLLWWPAHVPGDGPEWLVIRGLLWTLAFEILMLSFCPLERALTGAVRDRRAGTVEPRGLARALVLATAGLAVPAMLVGGTGGKLGEPEKASAAAPQKVIVKREIVRREVVVRRVNHVVRVPVASAPAQTPAAAATAAARAPRVASPAATTERTATRVVATPKRQAPAAPTASAKAKTTTAPPAATTAKPAATTATPAATTPAARPAAPAAVTSTAPATAPAAGN